MKDSEKTITIRKGIIEACKTYRAEHPILQHQDAIGATIFIGSTLIIVLMSILYLKGMVSAWILIPWNAFWMAILHEMEHDLIHYMYFKKSPWISDIFLGLGWILRPLTVNPWMRRTLHFHHHKYSGTIHDVEERGVTNGEKWGLIRLLGTPDILFGGTFRFFRLKKDIIKSVKSSLISRQQAIKFRTISLLGLMPFTMFLYWIWYAFLIFNLIVFLSHTFGFEYTPSLWWQQAYTWIQPLVVILIAPNILRQFCLHFITSNLHYYGDVESGNILQQTQVLNVWWTFPMQLFCFFFGHTHAIHHFHVNETFYIRHLTRRQAWKVMKENGVRFNDLGTFRRSNRYKLQTS